MKAFCRFSPEGRIFQIEYPKRTEQPVAALMIIAKTRDSTDAFEGVCVGAECRQSRLAAAIVAAAQLFKTPTVCLAAWLRGCVAAWLPGCLAAWLPGCTGCARCATAEILMKFMAYN